MPVYNGSRFVEKAIDSILSQTYQQFELLIIDDTSTDATWSILQRYQRKTPSKIRLFRLRKNVGAFLAANIALKKAKGMYIAPMDSDDISHKRRLEKEVQFLQEHRDIIAVGSYVHIINAKGHITGNKQYKTDHEGIYKQFALVNPIVHPSMMIRRNMLPHQTYLYLTQYGVSSDYYTFFELLNYGKFANIPEYLLSYRIHGKNSSLQNLKEKFYTITHVRLNAIKHFHYNFPLVAVPFFIVQIVIVTIVPESFLLPLYLMLRGMKPLAIPQMSRLSLSLPRRALKYAFSLL